MPAKNVGLLLILTYNISEGKPNHLSYSTAQTENLIKPIDKGGDKK